jgi:hypothetical protein
VAGSAAGFDTEALRAKLEADAAAICGAIACDSSVCALSGVSFNPSNGSLTSHGALAVTIEADITMWYYL